MRIILVDDEPLALAYLEKLLVEIGGLTIIGSYTNPNQAIQSVIQHKPDLIFLDINLPDINGIDFAEQVQSILPEVHIVFITAYDEYAVKAFELNAIDYVMKPVQRDRLNRTINRITDRKTVEPLRSQTDSKIISCFQTLHFQKGSEIGKAEPIDVNWRTAKARELFAYLVQHRKQPVRKDVLLEFFWPESDVKKGYAQLYSAIYQIRKMLDSLQMNSTVVSFDKSYKLHLNGTKLDVEEWERELRQLPNITEDTLPSYRRLLETYKGDYLAEEAYLWAENERERLRTLYHSTFNKVTTYYLECGYYTDAITLCQRVQTLHPLMETSYFLLMQVYAKMGDNHSVKSQYEKLNHVLEAEYGIHTSDSIENWYNEWKKQLQ
ncbi:response regulator [Halalkalibacterium halodurans]|uniref:response regulator n=4 Tax=Halalkalibacterium halodurans TaxID=86665 RepID=UPI002AA9D6DE|nr:response regulator [Halalkalibacterium halodurans]MDY7222574.1 response regulator [Halalkalibacterium halodurans]MDY7241795.1 response regulator [Halalkalibacterium halodurans]MED4086092.1 response regulator [Halalkalibacterium halodurans]MED4106751.1 response regulator [Halalkalibacterium halodurans]MED4109508.1 response regulator [Halalkalibacterium halodurans]